MNKNTTGDTAVPPTEPHQHVYSIDGKRVLSMVTSLESLKSGIYIVNGKKTAIK